MARTLEASRTSGTGNTELASLERKVGDLTAIRTQVETARSPSTLSQLKIAVSEGLRYAAELVSSTQNTLTSGPATTNRQIAEASYHARVSASERAMREIMRRDAQGFVEADAFAKAHGIDGSEFADSRSALTLVAADYRKKGDRVGAIVADGLNSRNTADYWQKIADETGNEEAQRKADHYRRLAEQADAESRKAVQAEVEREATDRGMAFRTPEERKAWIEEQTDRRHQERKDEVIDAAVATGQMSAERGEQMKGNVASERTATRSSLAEQHWSAGNRDTASVGAVEVTTPALESAEAVAAAQKSMASANRFADARDMPAQLPPIDSSVQAEARKAAAPIARSTTSASAEPDMPAVPLATPVQVASTTPGKSSSITL